MRISKRAFLITAIIVFPALFFQSCVSLQELGSALTNLKRLQFKLGQVQGFSLAGIKLGQISSLTSFSPADGLRLLSAFRNKELPAEFVLEVLALNPNDGTGGSQRSVTTLTSLESRLLIDGNPTVTGNIDRAFEIPGTGQASVIPIRLSLNLFEFFGNRSYEDVIGLALAMGGGKGSSSRLSLDARPRVSTPYGDLDYPGRITIIEKEFR